MSEKPQHKIYIDTTERYEKKVELMSVVHGKEKVVDSKTGDLDTVSAIKAILDENNLTSADIDNFEPNTGPGSFTGIKVGITITNVLNWALGRKKELHKPNYGKGPNIQTK